MRGATAPCPKADTATIGCSARPTVLRTSHVGKTLYLKDTKAQRSYACENCRIAIPKGAIHFRHDPHPYARQFRDEPTTHWCHQCITAAEPTVDQVGRFWVPVVKVASVTASRLLAVAEVRVVPISSDVASLLASDPAFLHSLSPEAFENLMCDRLFAMGYEPKKLGATFQKDGGIDIVFWPRVTQQFPILGAMQVKHHRDPRIKEGPRSAREFWGVLADNVFNLGLLVTNTTFTPDARWFAQKHEQLLRLRDCDDVRRWLRGTFDDEAEWREFPDQIELCPGVVIPLRSRNT